MDSMISQKQWKQIVLMLPAVTLKAFENDVSECSQQGFTLTPLAAPYRDPRIPLKRTEWTSSGNKYFWRYPRKGKNHWETKSFWTHLMEIQLGTVCGPLLLLPYPLATEASRYHRIRGRMQIPCTTNVSKYRRVHDMLAWLKEFNGCLAEECLVNVYLTRFELLPSKKQLPATLYFGFNVGWRWHHWR